MCLWRNRKIKPKDLTGKKFNRLTAVEVVGKDKHGNMLWLCKCDCGNATIIPTNKLTSNKTKSCGCLKKETAKPPVIVKHGMSYSRLYQVWKDMKGRCYRPTSTRYYTHGARGVKVCAEWQTFEPFYKWALSNGYQENLTLDRINNDGNYEPSNCRWATMKTQANNRRTNHFLTYKGETHTLKEWAEIIGINYNTLVGRINRLGWSIEKTLNKK